MGFRREHGRSKEVRLDCTQAETAERLLTDAEALQMLADPSIAVLWPGGPAVVLCGTAHPGTHRSRPGAREFTGRGGVRREVDQAVQVLVQLANEAGSVLGAAHGALQP
ncbi:hypothetical protein CG747_42535 [Streptomyces sp. CB02959]|nr:hypothetical protein CG747_42535 [Streptomyces sp. CB02959]